MAIEIVWEKDNVLYVKYSGTVTGEDARKAQDSTGSDPRFDDLKGIIVDGSKVSENLHTDIDVEILSSISRAQAISNPNLKNAVITDPSDKGLALSTFYKMLAEESSWEIELFHNEEDARKWVELK
jgi:hypothetical protein